MRPRVLYIEDDRDNMVLVRRILNAADFELYEATTAKVGLVMAEERQPDVILMDINLPEMDGLTATRHVRENPKTKHIPVIALTANVMHDILEKAMAVGCDGYIAKPIQVDTLPDEIRKYIRKS